MNRQKRILGVFVVALFLVSCASVGGGDPLVVKTEDTLSNSLTLYDQVMRFHFVHSKEEGPALYAVLEKGRIDFPIVWKAVFDAETAYRQGRGTKGDLQRTLDVLGAVVASLSSAGVLK